MNRRAFLVFVLLPLTVVTSIGTLDKPHNERVFYRDGERVAMADLKTGDRFVLKDFDRAGRITFTFEGVVVEPRDENGQITVIGKNPETKKPLTKNQI